MVGAVDFYMHTLKGTFVHKLKLPHCSVLDKPLRFYMCKIRRREEGENSNAFKKNVNAVVQKQGGSIQILFLKLLLLECTSFSLQNIPGS